MFARAGAVVCDVFVNRKRPRYACGAQNEIPVACEVGWLARDPLVQKPWLREHLRYIHKPQRKELCAPWDPCVQVTLVT